MVRSVSSRGRRGLIISDSQAAIGALSKGRSSRPIFDRLCRRVASIAPGLGMTIYWRYVRASRNHADGPSRGYPLGVAPSSEPSVQLPGEEMSEEFRTIAG